MTLDEIKKTYIEQEKIEGIYHTRFKFNDQYFKFGYDTKNKTEAKQDKDTLAKILAEIISDAEVRGFDKGYKTGRDSMRVIIF